MCKRYGFDPITLCPQLECVFEHMSKQGWDPKKWKENEGPIRCAIFYWVCNVQKRKLRDLTIMCEELSVPLRLVKSVVKSMESIRGQLVPLSVTEPVHEPTSSSRPMSPASTSLKRKAGTSNDESGSASVSQEPSSKRIRTESVSSEAEASEDEGIVAKHEAGSSRRRQAASRTSEDIDGESLQGTMSSGPSSRRQAETDPDVDIAEEEATPRRQRVTGVSASRAAPIARADKRRTDRVSGPPILHYEASMEVEEQHVTPRYRPVFPDRSFYASVEAAPIIQEHDWGRWLEDKRKLLSTR
ncbi:hypothetical protein FS837_006079 [Tulasnella sp. UAMH 9824]|nr:hypothetical protein FS837_006079 [Tulasnella sp. UAMH 9824]